MAGGPRGVSSRPRWSGPGDPSRGGRARPGVARPGAPGPLDSRRAGRKGGPARQGRGRRQVSAEQRQRAPRARVRGWARGGRRTARRRGPRPRERSSLFLEKRVKTAPAVDDSRHGGIPRGGAARRAGVRPPAHTHARTVARTRAPGRGRRAREAPPPLARPPHLPPPPSPPPLPSPPLAPDSRSPRPRRHLP
jgi:hypothetical protein